MANAWCVPLPSIEGWCQDLVHSDSFLRSINQLIKEVPEFAGVEFTDPGEFRLYRCLLYLLTRAFRPEIFVETGVLNGFSSAFILLAMEHNHAGQLFSIDQPPLDERIRAQGTGALPTGKGPGWAIPEELRSRHRLSLGDSRVLLPKILEQNAGLDVFLHDSDHSYEHMMFEMSLSWTYLRPGGWLLCDNVEANESFSDFTRGAGVRGFVEASFDSSDRVWKHGMARKR